MPEYFEEIDAHARIPEAAGVVVVVVFVFVVFVVVGRCGVAGGRIYPRNQFGLDFPRKPETFSKATRYPSAEEGVNA